MRPNEVILELLKDRNMSQRELAIRIGSCPQTVNHQLTKADSIKMDVFASMLDELGYEIQIVPKKIERPGYILDVRNADMRQNRPEDK